MYNYKIINGQYSNNSLYDVVPIKAQDTFLIDKKNKRYLDLRRGLWNVSLGYQPDIYSKISKEFDNLLTKQLPYLDNHSFKHPIYQETAETILKFVGKGFNNVIYTNSGSENTELSLKLSNYINKKGSKSKILTFKNSYHGTFFGGMSVSGIDQELNQIFNPKYGYVTFLEYPTSIESENEILKKVNLICSDYDVMFIEPVLASAGVYTTTIEFMNKLIKILHKNNVIVVFDEVATGFYRTGNRFYFNQLDYIPDLLCLSKGINNGITPFGCVCIGSNLNEKLKNSVQSMEHFSTQNGNLLGILSANIVIHYYIKNADIINQKVQSIESVFREILFNSELQYRKQGAMLAIKIKKDHATVLVKELEKLGILTYLYFNNNEEGLSIFPPFNIDLKVLKKALRIIIKHSLNYQ